MAQQPDHCSVTWETWVQRDGRQLSWEVHDWSCSHGKIQSSPLTELFNFALSPPSGQPEPPSLQLLMGNCIQLLLPYRGLSGGGLETPSLSTMCISLRFHSSENLQEGRFCEHVLNFKTKSLWPSSFASACALNQCVQVTCACDMWMSELHSLWADSTQDSQQRCDMIIILTEKLRSCCVSTESHRSLKSPVCSVLSYFLSSEKFQLILAKEVEKWISIGETNCCLLFWPHWIKIRCCFIQLSFPWPEAWLHVTGSRFWLHVTSAQQQMQFGVWL